MGTSPISKGYLRNLHLGDGGGYGSWVGGHFVLVSSLVPLGCLGLLTCFLKGGHILAEYGIFCLIYVRFCKKDGGVGGNHKIEG